MAEEKGQTTTKAIELLLKMPQISYESHVNYVCLSAGMFKNSALAKSITTSDLQLFPTALTKVHSWKFKNP